MTTTLKMIEDLLGTRQLYTGPFDRLWAELEAARIAEEADARGMERDGCPMSQARIDEIWAYLNSQTKEQLRALAMGPTLRRSADGTYNQEDDEWGIPQDTQPKGIKCGNHPRDYGIRHESPSAVSACYAIGHQMRAEQAAECWAEDAWLRAAESAGEDDRPEYWGRAL